MTKHKIINFILTFFIIIVMLGMMGLIGMVLGGAQNIYLALLLGIALLIIFPSLNPALVARLYGARPLVRHDAMTLYHYLDQLCDRAGIEKTPALYLVNSRAMFAFTTGHASDAVIVLSYGLISKLELPEIVGVMAHETSHIMHKDLWLMSLTDLINRLMTFFALFGQLFVLMFLPAYLFWDVPFPWLGVAILIIAPFLNAMLQSTLSRIREYAADYTAATLMGTAMPLARALKKIQNDEKYYLQRYIVPRHESKAASMFQTHPKIEKRVEKLLSATLPHTVRRMF